MLLFELDMPGVGSWNGKWSGKGNYYAMTAEVGRATEHILAAAGYFPYSFGDGWVAGVSVKSVDAKQAARARKKSRGFCGYDWMVDSIIQHGEIVLAKAKP